MEVSCFLPVCSGLLSYFHSATWVLPSHIDTLAAVLGSALLPIVECMPNTNHHDMKWAILGAFQATQMFKYT